LAKTYYGWSPIWLHHRKQNTGSIASRFTGRANREPKGCQKVKHQAGASTAMLHKVFTSHTVASATTMFLHMIFSLPHECGFTGRKEGVSVGEAKHPLQALRVSVHGSVHCSVHRLHCQTLVALSSAKTNICVVHVLSLNSLEPTISQERSYVTTLLLV